MSVKGHVTLVRVVKVALAVAAVSAIGGLLIAVLVLVSIPEPKQADEITECVRNAAGHVTDTRTTLDIARANLEIETNALRVSPEAQAAVTDALAATTAANDNYQQALQQSHDDPSGFVDACHERHT